MFMPTAPIKEDISYITRFAFACNFVYYIFQNMPAKPFKRKVVERLKAKHQKNKKSFHEPNEASVQKSKAKEKETKKLNSYESVRKQQMLEGIEEEDKVIKKFETLLKMKKRKRKNLPAAFKDDGLDYLLEAIDKKAGEASILSDDDIGLEEDLAAVKGKPLKQNSEIKPTKSSQGKQRTLTELLREKEGVTSSAEEENVDEEEHCFEDDESDDENFDAEEDFDEENFAEGNSDLDSNEGNETENDKEENSVKDSKKPKVWEDIYGRLRDESGNVIQNSEAGKGLYIPPKLRKINTDSEDSKREECIKIKRQLKGY
ncbi:nucleolar MIF4G domain-containing protein 1 [Trichonephila clavata]|uniref:Nucleolar MIF4G domain-containing protein 1 n=1 Tax=Trichonephila clavata TaxID=2740835 RepID=A0A8X6L4T9_TRICU|nr:nucleolar MIF4G domain-containing protein 1 [Trichonephila clavata]